jgi:hypothetical protein
MTKIDPSASVPRDAGKQPYRRPALRVYGDVKRLTLHSASMNRRDSFFLNTRT